jgi:hypothetical protein
MAMTPRWRSSVLERIGDLEVFVFDENLPTRQRRQFGRRQHGRIHDLPGDDAAGGFDIREADGHTSSPISSTMP